MPQGKQVAKNLAPRKLTNNPGENEHDDEIEQTRNKQRRQDSVAAERVQKDRPEAWRGRLREQRRHSKPSHEHRIPAGAEDGKGKSAADNGTQPIAGPVNGNTEPCKNRSD